MSRKILGLDIREEAIAAVLLESGFKGSQMLRYGYYPVPPGDFDQGMENVLKALVETLRPGAASCVVGIPTTAVSFRNLSVPFHDLKKIRQILPFELEPSMPLPVEELIFDFESVRRDGHQDLLAFAARKSRIQRYIELLAGVNLNPVAIMPGGYAAARFISSMTSDNNDILLVDTGENHHTVYAVCAGSVRMARSLPVTGTTGTVLPSLESSLNQTIIAMGENMGIGVNPSMVFATGPQTRLLTAGSGSATLLGLTVKSIEGIRTFPRLHGEMQSADWEVGHLDVALALALMETESVSGINFSSHRSPIGHYWSEHRNRIIFSAVMIGLTVIFALAGQFMAIRDKSQRLEGLDRQIEMVFKRTFPEVTQVRAPLQQMQIKIREAGEGAAGLELPGTGVRVIDLLDALSQKIPAKADVKINRMVVGEDNLVLSGNTDTFNTVDDIKGRLEGADVFKQVTISSADQDKSGKGVRFKLKLDF